MARYRLESNMTARIFAAGSGRPSVSSRAAGDRGCADAGRWRQGDHSRRRAHRYGRACDRAGRACRAHQELAAGPLRDAVNANMRPHLVAVRDASIVADDFDARHSAIRRHYLYRIVNRRAPLTIDAGHAWLVKKPLDVQAMHEAAQTLVGKYDFTTFRDRRLPGGQPCAHAGAARRVACRRRNPHLHIRALVPAPAGALDGRLARTCRLRQVARARFARGARWRRTARDAARSRPPMGSISSASITRPRAATARRR